MFVIPDARLDQFMAEDIPYMDLTTHVLGIDQVPGRITFFTREAGVVCATEEAARILEKCGAQVEYVLPSGSPMDSGQEVLVATGSAGSLHAAWKVCLNLLDHCSAVATKTAQFVGKVKAVNPQVEVLTTRKSMPGTKDLVTKAIMAGGAFPHRLGLSETVLVFDNHTQFLGGFEGFLARVPEYKRACVEKRLFVEVNPDQAMAALEAGVDCLQIEKASPQALADLVVRLRKANPSVTVVAAGGVNLDNCEAYAAASPDGLVTTCLFSAKPLDMSARMECLE